MEFWSMDNPWLVIVGGCTAGFIWLVSDFCMFYKDYVIDNKCNNDVDW